MDWSSLRIVLEACLNPAVVVNQALKIVAINDKARELGIKVDDDILIACSLEGNAAQQLGQCFKSTNKKHFRAMLANQMETDMVGWRLSGPFRSANLVLLQFLDIAGARSHFVVSTVKNLELKAKKAQLEADKANAAKSMFLANMSHEIRTPLHAIAGLLELVADTDLNEKQRDYISKASASAKLLSKILNDVLDISKIQARQLELESIPFYLDSLVDQLDAMFMARAREKSLEFRCSYNGPEKLPLLGDPTRVMQVMINLCSNAIKFTSKGGVYVTVSQVKSGPETWFEFSFRDTGIGIKASYLPSMFDYFTQGDDATTRKYGGSGLGLAIVKELVEKMGGTIAVKSEANSGSEITLKIPFSPSEMLPVDAATSTANNSNIAKSTNVLVVDDNDINLEIARSMLESEQHLVTTATNGKVALEKLERQDFDLIFLDIQMPVMDGLSTIKAIRQEEKWHKLPVIALTANVMSHDIELYLQSGFDAHVSKPFNKDALLSALTKYSHKEKTSAAEKHIV